MKIYVFKKCVTILLTIKMVDFWHNKMLWYFTIMGQKVLMCNGDPIRAGVVVAIVRPPKIK